jgi:Domain of Unknown Function (DUF1259)
MRIEAVICAALLVAPQAPAMAQVSPAVWTSVEGVLGRKGTPMPGGVMRFAFPRTDLFVTVGRVMIKPALALGGWVAFKETPGGTVMAMGDLVLTEDEVAPVMRTLQAGGITQTALHNHVLNEAPHVMYMHVLAQGDPLAIARTLSDAIGKSRTPRTVTPPAPGTPAPAASIGDLDTVAIDTLLGVSGKLNGGVFQVSVPRTERITEMGIDIPASMGVATAINIQGAGVGKAAATGDFVLIGSEVAPVIKALTMYGIDVTAIHSHMVDETPRLYFVHFWASDDTRRVAVGLRAALDAIKH